MILDDRTFGSAVGSVALNIVGGLLTIPATFGISWVIRLSIKRSFRKIFGPGLKEFVITYGSLTLNPQVMSRIETLVGPPFERFPFTKPSLPGLGFSAELVASGSELRGAAYIAASLSRNGATPTLADDEKTHETLDADFVSLGALNNHRTLELLKNENNAFVEFDSKQSGFVSKKSKRLLYNITESWDYGVVVRIHPKGFENRTWICCAGVGEWGTSGAAWFLARKWKEIAKKCGGNEPFVAVVAVRQGKDESATLAFVANSSKGLEECLDKQSLWAEVT